MTNNETKIIPTIFSKNLEEFKKKYEKIKHLTKLLHLDIMDGHFVKSKSVDLEDLKFLKKTNNEFEAHLMCLNPQKYFEICNELNLKKVFIQFETFKSIQEIENLISQTKEKNLKFELALVINPQTRIEEIVSIINNFKTIMLMSVNPGAQGQEFIEETFNKIKELKTLNPNIKIQIDGGIKQKQIKKLKNMDANFFCVGSFLNESENPKENFKLLKNNLN